MSNEQLTHPITTIENHTPLLTQNTPLFPHSPTISTPFILRDIERWNWNAQISIYTMHYLISGQIHFEVNGISTQRHKGSCILLLPGNKVKAHAIDSLPVSIFSAHFLTISPEFQPMQSISTTISEIVLFELTAHRAVYARSKNRKYANTEVTTCLSTLFYLFLESTQTLALSPAERAVCAIADQIRQHPSQPWNLQGIADQLQISKSQLHRIFKKLFSMSPNKFIIEQRINTAQQLLNTSCLSITQVAEMLGYYNVQFFSRQFKQVTGAPPSHFQKID